MAACKRAFVLMPFRDPYDSYYPVIFKPALEAAGYEVRRADDLFAPRPIMLDIQEYILEADLILCEMSERNPNVFYELGLAHAIGKPAILVSRQEGDIPFDLRHIRTIIYDYTMAGWDDKLRQDITAAACAITTSDQIWPPSMDAQQHVPATGPALALEAEQGTELTGRVAYAANSRLYGMAYERLSAVCTVRPDGSAVFVREHHLLAHAAIPDMSHYMLFPEASPQGVGQRYPAEIQVEPIDTTRRLTPQIVELSSGKRSLAISIAPRLHAGQTLCYRVTEQSALDLYNITGRAPRKRPDDYFAWDISRPTKELELCVSFPQGFNPSSVWTDVWYAVGQSESTHAQEYDRVRRLLRQELQETSLTLSLQVPYPVLGLTYVILWMPPQTEQT